MLKHLRTYAIPVMALILMIALGIGLGTALVGADRGAKH